MKTVYAVFSSPFGWCGLVGGEQGLLRVFLPEHRKGVLVQSIKSRFPAAVPSVSSLGREVKALAVYFRQGEGAFPWRLDFSGTTAFQRAVWAETKKIPCGSVRTYGWIARQIGSPEAARAVGTALGRNPFPIIIPCHRVIRENGGLGGFSASRGIALKRELLELEKRH